MFLIADSPKTNRNEVLNTPLLRTWHAKDASLGTRKTKTGESKVWNTNLMKNQRREVETTTLAEISKNREERGLKHPHKWP